MNSAASLTWPERSQPAPFRSATENCHHLHALSYERRATTTAVSCTEPLRCSSCNCTGACKNLPSGQTSTLTSVVMEKNRWQHDDGFQTSLSTTDSNQVIEWLLSSLEFPFFKHYRYHSQRHQAQNITQWLTSHVTLLINTSNAGMHQYSICSKGTML